jgi:hypothetical protein
MVFTQRFSEREDGGFVTNNARNKVKWLTGFINSVEEKNYLVTIGLEVYYSFIR